MIVTRFATPFGAFEVLRNGRCVGFSIVESDRNVYCVGDTPLHADGCYVARISMTDMRPGDRVVARYVEESDGMLPDGNGFGGLVPDGGDEDTVNAVVELPSYAVGMGCIDTPTFEDHWSLRRRRGDASMGLFLTPRMFPYSWRGLTARGDGFEFRIEDEPGKYLCYRDVDPSLGVDKGTGSGAKVARYADRTTIEVVLVWDATAHDYAGDIVSFLTC
jgi:hypothetical protein